MKILLLFIFITTYSDIVKANIPNATVIQTHETEKLTNIDILLKRVKERKWEQEELPCLNTLLDALNESKNFTLWAVWMVDSMQLPVGQLYGSHYHIGNYDECINPPWIKTHSELKTQYCVADLHLTESFKSKHLKIFDPKDSAETYIKTRTKHDRDLGRMTWGTCVPEACKSAAIIKIYRSLLEISHLSRFSEEANITITSCEVAGRPNELPKELCIFLSAIAVIVILASLSSYYTKHYYNPDVKSYFQEVIRSFCFRRNIDSLTNVRDDEIYILNLMRLVSSVTIVFGHFVFALYGRMIVNGLRVEEDIDNFVGYTHHLDLLVDTFFSLSGLLLVRGFINGNWTNPIKFLTKRYLRVAICAGVMTYFKTYISYYLNDGPFWPKLAGPERDNCINNGWHNLLMTANYISKTDSCNLISWSPPVDFHMSVIAVIICYIYRMDKQLGLTIFWTLLSLAAVIAGTENYNNQLPPLAFNGIESLVDYHKNILLESTYIFTHTRGGTFLVGMILGYIFGHYKPNNFKNVISKKWSYTLILLALTIMVSILVIAFNLYLYPDRLKIAIFAGTTRILWSMMVCIIIAVSEYGDLGGIRHMFRWSPLIPVSRLTFGVFLLHMIFVEHIVMATRTLYGWDKYSMLVDAIGIIVLSFLGSFWLWLLVEAPTVNLANLFLDGIKTKKSKSTAVNSNVSSNKNGLEKKNNLNKI